MGTFSANGEYLAGWAWRSVGVWRVKDGKQVATMKARFVQCLAVSNDGRWIAAGTFDGDTLVWDANTYKRVFEHYDIGEIHSVDFSPDSTRLVSAKNGTAIVWDIATNKQVRTLRHEGLIAAKYSPQGDQIATVTLADGSVRVWDNNSDHLLVDIPLEVSTYNTDLLWFHNHLFVLSKSEIKKFDSSTGSALSQWPVLDGNKDSRIALPNHGEFIAYSVKSTVTFWDTSRHNELGVLQLPENSRSIALSPDGLLLASGGKDGKITIQSLSHITVSIVFVWITTFPNMFLTPLVIPNRIRFNPLVYSTFPRNLTSRSMAPCWTHGNMASSQTRKRSQ